MSDTTTTLTRPWILAAAGAQFGTLWIMKTSIIPLLDARPYGEYVRNAQLIDMHLFHPIAFWNGIVTTGLGAFAAVRSGSPRQSAAYALGSVAMLGVGLTSEGLNRPIWRQLEHWDPHHPPTGWARLRRRWNRAHDVRTLCAAVALGAFTAAQLLGDRS